ncbi:antifreeze protein [Rhodobacterales bacterium]|nr:antifreeze protein [Rhodobacterales bacterium]
MRLDICVLADIRKGDVAAPSHAASIEAFVAAGYRVGVLPVAPALIRADPYVLDPDYAQLFEAGEVKRLGPGAKVDCALAIGFDARVFAVPFGSAVTIRAAQRVVTLERPRVFASLAHEERERLRDIAEEVLGGPVIWAPTTSICRDALSYAAPDWPTTDEDWYPVVPSGRTTPRDAIERARPAIGMARIARTRPGPWSLSVADGTRALGVANVMWRLRGGPAADWPVWPQPAPIEVWNDDRISLADFLSKVDILANADVASDDPCPVEALYALSSGVVPYLQPHYRMVFAGTALYGGRTQIATRAIEFHEDRGLAEDLRESAGDLLAGRFSAKAAASRVRGLIGEPRSDPYAPAVHAAPECRVLFYSTNGVGLGHLTRQLAIARRLPDRITPVFVSHSHAVDLVRRYGYAAEYLPYHAAYGERREHWNAALADALATAIGFYRPRAMVFDGNVPFVGLMKAMERCPDVARVWIRRAMWGPGRDTEALERAGVFDLIVEPGEEAWARDDGPTVPYRHQVLPVPPIRLLEQGDLIGREAACAQIGLDPQKANVLVALGSGNNIDTAAMTARTLAHLHGRHGLGMTVAQWRIAGVQADLPAGVTRLADYPFGKFLRAFDFAVAAAGYNTFSEHLSESLPTIWVPNEHAEQDRQILRARFAEARGLGCLVRHCAEFDLPAALDRMSDPDGRAEMRSAHLPHADRFKRNGARQAAMAIASLCETHVVRE